MNNMAVLKNEQFLANVKYQQFIRFQVDKVEENTTEFCDGGNELEEWTTQFKALVEKMIANPTAYEMPKRRAIYAVIKFKYSECCGMDKDFKRQFRMVGRVARIEKSMNEDEKTFTYTIRYRRNGYKIEVSSTDLNEAKQKFIEATKLENIKIGA